MNQLLDKFNEYKSIVNYRIEYIFEDNSVISFKLKQTDFPHLLGLHKLIDIPVIRQFNDKNNLVVGARYINSKNKKQELLTENIIRRSIYFPDIEVRFNSFKKENILTMSYTDVIVDFNASLIGSNLNAKYILFEKKMQGYNHFMLCIAAVNGYRSLVLGAWGLVRLVTSRNKLQQHSGRNYLAFQKVSLACFWF